MRRFPVGRTGRVLLFAAEDALHVVRQRLAGIARAAGRELADLDIQVITAPAVRLDVERDRDALTATVEQLRPRLLVLDPFVRLHRIDENRSGEVAPLLEYLRELQRRYHAAVVLERIPRLGRLEPLPPPPRRSAHAVRRAPRGGVEQHRAAAPRHRRRQCRRAAAMARSWQRLDRGCS